MEGCAEFMHNIHTHTQTVFTKCTHIRTPHTVCTYVHTYILYNEKYWHGHRFCGLEIFRKIYQILCSSISVTESGLGVLYLINGSMCGLELLIQHEASYLEPEKQLLWSVYYRRTVGHRCQGNMQHYLLIRLDWDAAFFRVVLYHAACGERCRPKGNISLGTALYQCLPDWKHSSCQRF